jgi:hypothetical protein
MTSATVFAIQESPVLDGGLKIRLSFCGMHFLCQSREHRGFGQTRHCAAAIVATEWLLTCFETAVLKIKPKMHCYGANIGLI